MWEEIEGCGWGRSLMDAGVWRHVTVQVCEGMEGRRCVTTREDAKV